MEVCPWHCSRDNGSGDAEFLLSSQGRQDIVDLHVNGILDFCNNISDEL